MPRNIHEYGYRIPTDGTQGQFLPPFANGARTLEIINATNQTCYFWDDTGYAAAVPSGKVASVGVEQSSTWTFQLAGAAATVNSRPPLCYALFSDVRRPTSGDFYTGTGNTQGAVTLHHTASVVTIAGGTGTLGARATRNGGILRARKANVADIVIESSGFHLQPGDSISIAANDVYTFSGTNGDVLDVYEEYN